MVNKDIIVYSNSGSIRQKVNFYDHVKKMEDSGVGELILTSIDHEGDMNGYDIETLYKVSRSALIPIIASGGAGKLEDFSELIEKSEVSALAAASIYHFTNFTPRDVKIHLKSKNIPVRL